MATDTLMSPLFSLLLLVAAGALVAVAFGLRRSGDPGKQRAATMASAVAGAAMAVSILLLGIGLLA